MANSLNRDIREGEAVVMNGNDYLGNLVQRVFICKGGFGMLSETSGSKIRGHWLFDMMEDVVRGQEIDAEATAQMWETVGEFLKGKGINR